MSPSVIVLGAGGHAKVLIHALKMCSIKILGITDTDPTLVGQEVLGVPIIGTDEEINTFSKRSVRLVNGLGSVDLPIVRNKVFEKYKNQGFDFITVIHPSAIVASDAKVGEGVQIMAGAILQPGVRLGDNVIINTKASVDHDCIIGSHSHISPGVTLSGNVHLGYGTHIGTGASVVQSVHIGDSCLIGAGSLVLNDISAGVKAYGCPAKVVAS